MLFPVKSRIVLVWPKLEGNPSGWLWIFSTHHLSSVSAPQISLWCVLVLRKPVACVGSMLIYCVIGESRLVAYFYSIMWCPLRIFWNFTPRTWKITLTVYPDGTNLSHGCITFYCHIYLFLETNFTLSFAYISVQVSPSVVLEANLKPEEHEFKRH